MVTLFGRELIRPRKPGLLAARPVTEALARAPDAVEASLQAIGRSRAAQAAPVLLFATGAGVAFWWWTQWARGRAESEAAAAPQDEPRS